MKRQESTDGRKPAAVKKPAFDMANFFILTQVQFLAMSIFFEPLAAIIVSYLVLVTAASYCSPDDYMPIARAGSVLTALGFIYVLVKEVWLPSTRAIKKEIEEHIGMLRLDERAESKEALRKMRAFGAWAQRMQKPVTRTFEAILVLGGTLLSGFGDLLKFIF